MCINRTKLFIVVISILGLHASMDVARADVPCEVAQLSPSDADQGFGMGFGWSVAISGDYIAIGAPQDSELADQSGAVYVFKRDGSGWIEQAKLTASDGGFHHTFGRAVDIDGDLMVVGAPHYDPDGAGGGDTYAFRLVGDNWVEEAKLIPSLSSSQDSYGWSVSVNDNVMVVGAPGLEFSLGRAFVFRWNSIEWIQESAIQGADAAAGDSFGVSVSISNSRILIGAHGDDDGGDESGSAYVFGYNGVNWVEETKLIASDADVGDAFGGSVSIYEDYAVVSAINNDDGGVNSGSVYVYWFDTDHWVEQIELIAFDADTSDQFGRSVVNEGDRIFVGSPGDDHPGSQSGSIYIFSRAGANWNNTGKLLAGNISSVGFSLAVDTDYVVSVASIYGIGLVSPCIPTVSQWGLIVMSSILLIAGVIILRKHSYRAACHWSAAAYPPVI